MLNFFASAFTSSSRPLLATSVLAALVLTACSDNTATEGSSDTGTTGTPPETTTTVTTDLATTTTTTTTGDIVLLCEPGAQRCADTTTREVCKPTGLQWEPASCGNYQTCTEQGNEEATIATCVGPCEKAETSPTSVGCEFLAIRVRSGNGEEDLEEFYDALLVGNPDDKTASVQLYFTPNLSYLEAPLGEPVILKTGESTIFKLTNSTISGFSAIRAGGIYRVKSDIPVIAYLHSPLKNSDSNDSSMLLPIKSLRQDYVVASYPALVDPNKPDLYRGRPSFFNVIALENKTTISWTPPKISAGNGLNLPKVLADETGTVELNRFDLMQIGASTQNADGTPNTDYKLHDISGTVIHADKPIWVLSGTACANVPFESPGYCNHLQEQMIPIEYWGTKYVGAHSPLRADEMHYWRVYAGADDVYVTFDPQNVHPPFKMFRRGDFIDMQVPNGVSFTFKGTGPFMPVQYLASSKSAGGNGDPAMYQTIPIEQYLKRYVFVTGIAYEKNYAQLVRVDGSAPILVNGAEVPEDKYYLVNAVGLRYRVYDMPLDPGDEPKFYVAESADPFSLSVIGYVGIPGSGRGSAYAYPGGMALNSLNIP